MNSHRCRHLFVTTFVILALIVIETWVYFTIAEPIESTTSIHIIEDIGSNLNKLIRIKPAEKEVCQSFKDTNNNANRKVWLKTITLLVVVIIILGIAGFLLYKNTLLSSNIKELVLIEVVAICIAFFAFDVFFFKVIVDGHEPATASGLLTKTGTQLMNTLTYKHIRQKLKCDSIP